MVCSSWVCKACNPYMACNQWAQMACISWASSDAMANQRQLLFHVLLATRGLQVLPRERNTHTWETGGQPRTCVSCAACSSWAVSAAMATAGACSARRYARITCTVCHEHGQDEHGQDDAGQISAPCFVSHCLSDQAAALKWGGKHPGNLQQGTLVPRTYIMPQEL
eukprot:1160256-Pelagomonas_calceolata.AAC.2